MDINVSLKTELFELEESLLRSEVRKSFQDLCLLLADDFVEIASSGRSYNKQEAIEAMLTLSLPPAQISDFEVRLLTPVIALATYRLVQKVHPAETARCSLRSSIWRWHNNKQWQIVFHQGTICADYNTFSDPD